ncbi:MAG: 3'(2'),5'-bisphosphate nucleotidase CysQ [Gloeocapsa sp. DLM2.Bin57]|nr:MAG: 3'(2'),5'-bisphosphate nucleotidase CysQ [Gloeocapsa sp. DLM2.Bin57]
MLIKLLIVDTAKLEEILNLTRSVAWGASDILRKYYRGAVLEDQSVGKDGPVTAADLACNHYILASLQTALQSEEFGYLSEETYKKGEIFTQPYVWIIDPLDGTRDFLDKTGEYAIHIALTSKGRPILAVVAIPEAEKIYYAVKNQGTYVETRDGTTTKVQVSDRQSLESLYLVVSRTHRDERFQKLIDQLPWGGRNYVGSVGKKIATILEQDSDVYISLSGKSAPKDWDFAAPELILTEAGGKVTYFDGSPLTYNKGDANQWGGIMASNGHIHEQLCTESTKTLAIIDSNS